MVGQWAALKTKTQVFNTEKKKLMNERREREKNDQSELCKYVLPAVTIVILLPSSADC